MSDLVLTGLSANDPEPGVFLETNFAAGPSSGFEGVRPALLIGNKTSTGSATPDTVLYGPDTPVQCTQESEVIALFGAGSPLHRAWRRWTRINPSTPVYLIAVTESGGTAASLAITLDGTASGNGNIKVAFDDEAVECGVTAGDTVTVQAANLADRINAKTHWPFTASAALGVVTLTYKVKGPRGNFGRIQNRITSGITTSITQTADTAFSGGATADSNTAALATVVTKTFYYIVSEAEDAGQLGAVVTQVGLQAAPTSGIRQRVFAGSVDSVANTITVATGRNTARAEIIGSYKNPFSPFEIAAHMAAIYALGELPGKGGRRNFAGFPLTEADAAQWSIPAPRDVSAHPTRPQRVAMLNAGVTPIGVTDRGTTYLVNRITTRSQTGGAADYRIRDAHKVTICDFISDDFIAMIRKNFGGKKLGDDPPKGGRQPGPTVVTPRRLRTSMNLVLNEWDEADELQEVEKTKAEMTVARQVSNRQAVGARVPLRPIDIALKFLIAVDQVA